MSVLYKAPLGINVSGIVRYHSATPYTDWKGHDITGDGFGFDLTPGVSNVNSLRGDSFSQTDVRLSKSFKFFGNYGIEVIGEVFNLLNSKNAAGFRGNREVQDPVTGNFIPNPAFGTPSKFAGDPGLGEQRLAQLGLRVTF
jgi:hypothetical protein